MDYKILGENVRKARKELNMTQEKISEIIDLSPVFISQIETGTRKPSLETVYKLSVALSVSTDTLLKNTESKILTPDLSEIHSLLQGRTENEIQFATNMVRELMNNLIDGKIKEHTKL